MTDERSVKPFVKIQRQTSLTVRRNIKTIHSWYFRWSFDCSADLVTDVSGFSAPWLSCGGWEAMGRQVCSGLFKNDKLLTGIKKQHWSHTSYLTLKWVLCNLFSKKRKKEKTTGVFYFPPHELQKRGCFGLWWWLPAEGTLAETARLVQAGTTTTKALCLEHGCFHQEKQKVQCDHQRGHCVRTCRLERSQVRWTEQQLIKGSKHSHLFTLH